MKTLLLPTIQIKSKSVQYTPPSIYAMIVLLISFCFFAFLVFNGQYIFASLLSGLTVAGVICGKIYQELANVDYNTEEIDLTLEEIYDDLVH